MTTIKQFKNSNGIRELTEKHGLNHDRKYLRDQNLLKFFIGTKNKI
jgi:hypothetical protein